MGEAADDALAAEMRYPGMDPHDALDIYYGDLVRQADRDAAAGRQQRRDGDLRGPRGHGAAKRRRKRARKPKKYGPS